MKRYLAIGAGVLALLVAGWVFSWWSGRAGVERVLDAEVERLRGQGWDIAWQEREIGGFPFGYKVRLTGLTASDAESGLELRLPWAQAETAGADRMVVRMPESFALDVPLPPPVTGQQGEGAQAPMLQTTGEADDMVVVLGSDGTVEVSADMLGWVGEHPLIGRMAQTVEALEATTLPDAPGSRYRLHAALVTSEVTGGGAGGEAEGSGSTTSTLRDVTLEGSSNLPTMAGMGEMLYAGAPGQAQGSLTTGPAEVHMTGGADAPGTLDWRAESMRGRSALTSGRMELDGETRGNSWTVASPDPALPIQGQLSAGLAQVFYAMPMAPTGAPDEMAIRLSLEDATADEAIWQQIDPQGVLPRDPGSLLVDLNGTVRVTRRIDEIRPGAAPPFEVSSLILNEVAAAALGARVNATGELDILQPIGLPLGEIRVGMTGLAALVGALGRAGVVSPDMVAMADAIMQVYLRPAAGKDAWTAEIAFTRDGPVVNGMPLR